MSHVSYPYMLVAHLKRFFGSGNLPTVPAAMLNSPLTLLITLTWSFVRAIPCLPWQ